jgi:hypothetical protein
MPHKKKKKQKTSIHRQTRQNIRERAFRAADGFLFIRNGTKCKEDAPSASRNARAEAGEQHGGLPSR